MKKCQKYSNILYISALLILFAIALFVRLYRLDAIPDVTHVDEAGLGYNAWCVVHYGSDRHGNEMPIYFQNVEGGQSALYTYAVAFLIAAVGRGDCSLWLVRLPGFFSSMLTVLFGTRLIALLFKDRRLTLAAAALLTICPYFIMHGRYGLDCIMMLSCCTISLCLLFRYLSAPPDASLRWLILCGIGFGITLYSYALSYIMIPVFLGLTSLYLLYTRRITIRRILIWAAVVCVTALPVILYILSLLLDLEPFRFLCFTISPVASERMDEVSAGTFLEQLGNIVLTIRNSLTCDNLPLNAVDKYYTLYPLTIPFLVLGWGVALVRFLRSLKSRLFVPEAVFSLYFPACCITAGLTGGYYVYRINCIFIAYLYFTLTGLVSAYRFLQHYRRVFTAVTIGGYLWWFVAFCRYYFTIYSIMPIVPYPNLLYCDQSAAEALEYVKTLDTDEVYMDFCTANIFYYFLYPVSPEEYLAETEDNDHFEINYFTELLPGNAYIVNPANSEFYMRLANTAASWECTDFGGYQVYYFPTSS